MDLTVIAFARSAASTASVSPRSIALEAVDGFFRIMLYLVVLKRLLENWTPNTDWPILSRLWTCVNDAETVNVSCKNIVLMLIWHYVHNRLSEGLDGEEGRAYYKTSHMKSESFLCVFFIDT